MLERNGAPNRIRTGVTALRGLCPGPLDDGSAERCIAAGPAAKGRHYSERGRLLKLKCRRTSGRYRSRFSAASHCLRQHRRRAAAYI